MFTNNIIVFLTIMVAYIFLIGASLLFCKWTATRFLRLRSIREELLEKDNIAFGVWFASIFYSIFLLISSVATMELSFVENFELNYGWLILAMEVIFIGVSVFVARKFIVHKSQTSEIVKQRNIPLAIIGASYVVSTAYIIKFIVIFLFVHNMGTSVVFALVSCLLIQCVFMGATFVHNLLFTYDNQSPIKTAIANNNLALAFRYAGFIIFFSFLCEYVLEVSLQHMFMGGLYSTFKGLGLGIFLCFLLGAAILMFVYVCGYFLTNIIFFYKGNVGDEVNTQHNVAVAIIQLVIFYMIFEVTSQMIGRLAI